MYEMIGNLIFVMIVYHYFGIEIENPSADAF